MIGHMNYGSDLIMKYYSVNNEGYELRGLIHDKQDYRKYVVLVIHGYFSSNKIGPNRLYYEIGEYLNQNGFPVVRIDLRGMGESDGLIKDVTISNFASDIEKIISCIYELYHKKIIVISHSLGCLATLESLNCVSCVERVDRVILVAPMINSESTLNNLFPDKRQIQELMEMGFTYRKCLYSNGSFFSSKYNIEGFCEAILRFTIPFYLIFAKDDQIISLNDMIQVSKRMRTFVYIIDKADHNFLGENARNELYNIILECCVK